MTFVKFSYDAVTVAANQKILRITLAEICKRLVADPVIDYLVLTEIITP